MEKELTSVELLSKVHSGDRQALGQLLGRHREWLWSYVRRRMGDTLRAHEASEDVVQDVLRKLIEKGPAFIPQDDDQFRRLVATIVINRLRDRHDWANAERRTRGREVGRPADEITYLGAHAASVDQPSRVAAREEEQGLLDLALQVLDPDDAAVVRWRIWDELSFAQIGQRLDILDDAARMRFNRAVLRLGEMMRRLEEGDLGDLGEASLHEDGDFA